MRTVSRFVAALLVVAPLLLVGCGRAASTEVAPSEVVFSTAVPKDMVQVIPKDKVRAEAEPVVGVSVGGRIYPKGKAPAIAKAEKPGTPEAGKLAFTHMLRVVVLNADESQIAFYQDFYAEALVGKDVTANALNLVPGDYHVKLESYNAAGQLFANQNTDASVAADGTATAAL